MDRDSRDPMPVGTAAQADEVSRGAERLDPVQGRRQTMASDQARVLRLKRPYPKRQPADGARWHPSAAARLNPTTIPQLVAQPVTRPTGLESTRDEENAASQGGKVGKRRGSSPLS